MTRRLEVLRSGPLTTVQDHGRFGHRAMGVGPSGAADRGAMERANRLVGNPVGSAVLEATLGGLSVRVSEATLCAVTGAECPGATLDTPLQLEPGDTLTLATASAGVRTYVAVAGGIDVPPVLGSRSLDTLSGLGPPPLQPGDVIAIGPPGWTQQKRTIAAPGLPDGAVDLRLMRGPRDDWLPDAAWTSLGARSWVVSPDSDRVAVRLRGDALPIRTGSLAPEPVVRGGVQVPPDGRPIIFLADHPVTGGYPVAGVLAPESCDLIAQCRPGTVVRLVPSAPR